MTRDEMIEEMDAAIYRTAARDLHFGNLGSASLTALEQAGYVVVPRVPTLKMKGDAARNEMKMTGGVVSFARAHRIYTAMLTAHEGEG